MVNNKYKSLSKSIVLLRSLPLLRLKNFKSSKWIRLKKTIKKKYRFRFKFFLIQKIRFRRRRWYRVKRSYRQGLFFKKALTYFFGNSLRIKYFKAFLKAKNTVIQNFLINPFFKLDILLFKLKVFKSSKQALQAIQSGYIYLNTKRIIYSCFLKQGDIISMPFKKKFKNKSNLPFSFISSFCEIDFYTNTIIILKSPKALPNQASSLIYKNNMFLQNFIFYVSKS
jgi:hypothetical protein